MDHQTLQKINTKINFYNPNIKSNLQVEKEKQEKILIIEA
jgi:hypothetical protein